MGTKPEQNLRTESAAIAEFVLAGEGATARLAAVLAERARVPDVILLQGDLGAGKTAFARGFIAARLAADAIEAGAIPSPTFTLVQIYEAPSGDIWHFDLYRLDDPEETLELGIEEAFASAISLIEWPERLGAFVPGHALTVALDFGAEPDLRVARIYGGADWPARLSGLAA